MLYGVVLSVVSVVSISRSVVAIQFETGSKILKRTICIYTVVVVATAAAAAATIVIVLLLGGSSRRWCGVRTVYVCVKSYECNRTKIPKSRKY